MALNLKKTKEYYRAFRPEDLCDCAYCQTYRQKIKASYPTLTARLETLGIDIEKPFETMPLVPGEDGMIDYIGAQYVVFGNDDEEALAAVHNAGLRIADSHPMTDIEEEHFVIETESIRLKWDQPGELQHELQSD